MLLGCLLAAGHDQNHLLDTYSWQSLTQQGACIMRYHMSMLEMVAEPLIEAMDAEFNRGSVSRRGSPRTPQKRRGPAGDSRTFKASEVPAEDRDAALMGAFSRAGLAIESVKGSG